MLMTVAESSETTTGSVAEVDADRKLWLVRAYFEGGSEASELRVWCGKSMYPRKYSQRTSLVRAEYSICVNFAA